MKQSMMAKFLIWNFILLCGPVFVQCFDSFADNYKFTYAMASRCKEHVSPGQEYTTFYKVKQKFDSRVRFEMHMAILAPSDGHILLSPVEHPTLDDPVYEIAIGAGNNVFSELRKRIGRHQRISASTKDILSPINFRAFWIKLNDDGQIKFGREGVSTPTLSYHDPFPLPVRFFSFATWANIQGKFLYDCPFGQNETDRSQLNQKNLSTPVPSPPSVIDNSRQLNQKNLSAPVPSPPSVLDNSSQLNQKNLSAPVPSPPSVLDNSSQLNQKNLSAPVPSPPPVLDNSSQLNQKNLSAPVPSPSSVLDNSSQLNQKNLSAPVPSPSSVLDNSSQLNKPLNQNNLSAPVPSPPSVPNNSSHLNQPRDQKNMTVPVTSPAPVTDNISDCFCPPHPPCPIQPDTHINQPIAEKYIWDGETLPHNKNLPYLTPAQVKVSTPVFAPLSNLGFTNPYIDNNVRWVPSNKSKFRNLTGKALIAGHEDFGGIQYPLWIIRARHAGDLLPGKLITRTASAFLPYSEKEILIENFEVLCVNPSAVHWVPAAMGHIPPKAVPGGETVKGEKLYIGRVRHEGELTPGKIHPINQRLYIPYGRHEIAFRAYEVLVRV